MTADQRDKLLDLHRAAVNAMSSYIAGAITSRELNAADDAFRDYLMGLETTQ